MAQEHVVNQLESLCNGSTDRLILTGDCFEGCVPKDAGSFDPEGFSPFVSEVSRSFFEKLTGKIKIESLIILWGNHDYSMWKKIATHCSLNPFTNNVKGDVLLQYNGEMLPGSDHFLRDLIGPARFKFGRIRAAYPNYTIGRYWPYITFHHGHLLDDLILGQDSAAKYFGLKVLTGIGRPDINLNDPNTILDLHKKSEPLMAALYDYNSHERQTQWSLIRSGSDFAKCWSYPADVFHPAVVSHSEKQQNGLGSHLEWYVNTLMSDPTTPAPLGDASMPSYLFIGHDHYGGYKDVSGLDNHPWKIVNLGGWTGDGGCVSPHCHAAIWPHDKNEPTTFCLKF
jgi:hypothetical protein